LLAKVSLIESGVPSASAAVSSAAMSAVSILLVYLIAAIAVALAVGVWVTGAARVEEPPPARRE
jgi:hypothetical protein